MKSESVTIQMKATEQYFPVVLFIMLYKVVLTFQSVDESLKCDYSAELFRGAVIYTVEDDIWVCRDVIFLFESSTRYLTSEVEFILFMI